MWGGRAGVRPFVMVNRLLTVERPKSGFRNQKARDWRQHGDMRRDELRQPLKRRGFLERFWAKRPSPLQSAFALAALGMAAGATALVRTPYPLGGEPVVVAAIPPAEELKTASIEAAPEMAEAEMPDAAPPADEEKIEDFGAEPVIVDPPEQQTVDTGAQIIVSSRRSLAAAPVEAVSEEGPYGPLPRIGRNNKKPSAVYARMTSNGVIMSDAPKIAIVLGGMGLNKDLTLRAIKSLPGDVTFAFAPYGEDLQPLVNKARAGGHEIVLQIPMEPFGFPQTNPGPKTLVSGADTNANLDALMWHMGRFAGYAAVMNYMGGKFLADTSSLRPVLAEVRKRGLLFVGDGTVSNNTLEAVAGAAGLSVREAQVVIDADPTPASIGRALADLEARARREGVAIGSGAGLAITIDAVAAWAKDLDNRGIILIPVTAAFKTRSG